MNYDGSNTKGLAMHTTLSIALGILLGGIALLALLVFLPAILWAIGTAAALVVHGGGWMIIAAVAAVVVIYRRRRVAA